VVGLEWGLKVWTRLVCYWYGYYNSAGVRVLPDQVLAIVAVTIRAIFLYSQQKLKVAYGIVL
jgi:hypothetical protein